METAKIEQLLEKYWEGETSLEEEQLLARYFNTENIPSHLVSYASFFKGIEEGRAIRLTKQKATEIQQQLPMNAKSRSIGSFLKPNQWLKVAACIGLLLVSSYWLIPQIPQVNEAAWQEDTYEDPQEAYEEVRQTLMKLSKGLNEGAQEVGQVSDLHQGTSMISIESSSNKRP